MNKQDTIATLTARYIVRIGPDMTSGAMIALLSDLASDAYFAGETDGFIAGVVKQAEASVAVFSQEQRATA